MTAKLLLKKLKDLNIDISLKGDDLELKYSEEYNLSKDLIKEISSLKQEIINILRNTDIENIDISPSSKSDDYPLSSSQYSLWLLSQLEEINITYNLLPEIYVFEGKFNEKALEYSFNKLIDRHEILRTNFKDNKDGDVRQVVKNRSEMDFKLKTIDLTSYEDYYSIMEKQIEQDFISPFDLSDGSLMRARLFKVEPQKWILSFTMHHIISDGWSMNVIVRELMQFYTNYISDTVSELNPLKIQYKDYAIWEQELVNNEGMEGARHYWLNLFQNGVPKLKILGDKPRPKIKSFKGGIISSNIEPQYAKLLARKSSENGGTLFMGLLSLVNILLYKYTSQTDIVIGTPIAGRNHKDLEDQVGFYVNTLALRNEFKPSDSFNEIFQRLKKLCIDSFEHQIYPFNKLVSELNLPSDRSRNPLFDVMVVLQNTSLNTSQIEYQMGDLSVGKYQREGHQVSKFDLTFIFTEGSNGINLLLEYSSDIFSYEVAKQISNHFYQILKVFLENPNIGINSLDYLNSVDKHNLLENFNSSNSNKINGLLEDFSKRVIEFPSSLAIKSSTGDLTYSELDEKSDKLALFLGEKLNVKTGDKIGIYQNRSKELVISILAVLKAQAVFVPIDVDLPEVKIQYILEDSSLSTLLTDSENVYISFKLQWKNKKLRNLICVDSYDIYNTNLQYSSNNGLMNKELWDHVGSSATSLISGGGWVSSFTGEHFSEIEMAEYAENTLRKLESYLLPNTRVLEIGCSSGITMLKIAPRVGHYYGIDLSSSIIENTKITVKEKGLDNVKLSCLPAHLIHEIEEDNFDIIILNSVIQSFEGHNYLREVIIKSIDKLSEKGILYFGDVMDEDRRQQLISDLESFKKLNSGKFRTKIDWSNELFISKDFFSDIVIDLKDLVSVECSDKIYTIENELTNYRYDAIIQVNKNQSYQKANLKTKNQYDLKDVDKFKNSENKYHLSPLDRVAYIIYTSGSTGNPKGCQITYNNISNYISWANNYYFQFVPFLRFGVFTPISFDLTLTSIFCPLTLGGEMVICDQSNDLEKILSFCLSEKQRINTLKLTPGHIQFLSNKNIGSKHLSNVILGGDTVTEDNVEILFKINPNIRIYNEYGPTEATVGCITKELKLKEPITIGTPIWNTRAYILSETGHLCPIGVIGEICISGAGVAKGYLNRSELTESRFVSDPFQDGERMYRTGDMGRWLANGEI
ncbi:MAG: condensation domain-containing protein, partial [Sphingobacterium sp.]|uniref:condensation domain-containing protein n=1 Tax=Sphingobacterium sp. TaxID=341027 RepID=UPI00284A8EBB